MHVYSLKNVGNPEFAFSSDSGIMCLQFHPTRPSLLAVGCYDGTVRVFDVSRRGSKPAFMSDMKSGKHSDPVWEIHWAPESAGGHGDDPAAIAAAAAAGGELVFFTVSSDGRVSSWTVTKTELKMETVRRRARERERKSAHALARGDDGRCSAQFIGEGHSAAVKSRARRSRLSSRARSSGQGGPRGE